MKFLEPKKQLWTLFVFYFVVAVYMNDNIMNRFEFSWMDVYWSVCLGLKQQYITMIHFRLLKRTIFCTLMGKCKHSLFYCSKELKAKHKTFFYFNDRLFLFASLPSVGCTTLGNIFNPFLHNTFIISFCEIPFSF